MEALAVAAVVLLGLLAGFAIPVLLQLRKTLDAAQRTLETTVPKFDSAIAEFREVTERLNRIAIDIEDNTPRVKRVLDSAEGAAETIDGVKRHVGMVAAIGPAAFAAVKAFFSRSSDDEDEESDEVDDEMDDELEDEVEDDDTEYADTPPTRS